MSKHHFNEIIAVPAPVALSPALPADNVHDLIARKREAEKNKMRYHLTEKDCELLCSNAVPIHFETGQVICESGAVLRKIYRIKSGTVALYKGDLKFKELTRGYFLGEALLIRDTVNPILGLSVVAETPVDMLRIDLSFARQMLAADKTLAFKMYRHLAAKMSALLVIALTKVANEPELLYQVLPHVSSSSSISSDASDGSAEDSGGSGESSGASASEGKSSDKVTRRVSVGSDSSSSGTDELRMGVYQEVRNFKAQPRKKTSRTNLKTVPFKTYQLDVPQNGQCLLYNNRIKFTCTLRQRKINYNQILDMTKVGTKTITIIYKMQAKTIFFKTEDELTEFMAIVKSMRLASLRPAIPTTPSPTASPLNLSYDDIPEADKTTLHDISVRQDLKKGDVVIAEGDLYQRIYTVVSGQITSQKNGRPLLTIEAGETFGVLTLFHMRPAMVNLVVTSEVATVLIIPGYKIQELVNSNFQLAVRLYKKAAQVIYSQVEHTLTQQRDDPSKPLSVAGANRAFV